MHYEFVILSLHDYRCVRCQLLWLLHRNVDETYGEIDHCSMQDPADSGGRCMLEH